MVCNFDLAVKGCMMETLFMKILCIRIHEILFIAMRRFMDGGGGDPRLIKCALKARNYRMLYVTTPSCDIFMFLKTIKSLTLSSTYVSLPCSCSSFLAPFAPQLFVLFQCPYFANISRVALIVFYCGDIAIKRDRPKHLGLTWANMVGESNQKIWSPAILGRVKIRGQGMLHSSISDSWIFRPKRSQAGGGVGWRHGGT